MWKSKLCLVALLCNYCHTNFRGANQIAEWNHMECDHSVEWSMQASNQPDSKWQLPHLFHHEKVLSHLREIAGQQKCEIAGWTESESAVYISRSLRQTSQSTISTNWSCDQHNLSGFKTTHIYSMHLIMCTVLHGSATRPISIFCAVPGNEATWQYGE